MDSFNLVPATVEQKLDGHRREVNCFHIDKDILVAGGKDRRLTFWSLSRGKLLHSVDEAHSRLITSIRVKDNLAISSSRDKSIKVWRMFPHPNHAEPESSFQVDLLHTLTGHQHSVWTIDINENFLVSGSADRTIRVWRLEADDQFVPHCQFSEHHQGT